MLALITSDTKKTETGIGRLLVDADSDYWEC